MLVPRAGGIGAIDKGLNSGSALGMDNGGRTIAEGGGTVLMFVKSGWTNASFNFGI